MYSEYRQVSRHDDKELSFKSTDERRRCYVIFEHSEASQADDLFTISAPLPRRKAWRGNLPLIARIHKARGLPFSKTHTLSPTYLSESHLPRRTVQFTVQFHEDELVTLQLQQARLL